MVRRLAAAVLLLATVSPALSAPAADPAGCWSFRIGETALMQFDVVRGRDGWRGTWQRPAQFESDGYRYTSLRGPAIARTASMARAVPGGVELTFDDPAPDAVPDVFTLRAGGDGMTVASRAFGSDPAPVTRVACKPLSAKWDGARTYQRIIDDPSDPEMTALFAADQAARQSDTIDWSVVARQDAERRARTQQLLDAGRLRSGDDYYHAAFLFQHGGEPGDYLKAHALAVIAAARGKRAAAWIAAATLDRYLQSIGQPQVYGTQYLVRDGTATQGAYRRDLLSDALRAATGVPSLAEQEVQRADYEKQAKTGGS